ncbi:hypothetical protein [Paenibacillus lentus]|uniref:Uncharacterized protein n=1 Tax=Paenibacillus lentus TaxID=1338368 RepID=A0A3S8S0X3_9BACL|nr:hypothetical protein [Paenibacillus lentus]AZK48724.1 hypothetical protein EIM92_23165 [Paenibacillus lentus]
MLRLLKYDWKRNANLSLGLLAVLVLLQIAIGVIGNVRGWEQAIILLLSIMLYVMTGIILIILASKTYENNIKAYSRRLLPIRPVWSAVSSIVLWWIFSLVLGLLVTAHYFIYTKFVFKDFWWPQELLVADVTDWFGIIFMTGWSLTYLMVSILLSITIGASVSLRGKAGTWIGLLAFIVIQNTVSWVEHILFRGYDVLLFRIDSLEYSDTAVNAQLMPSASFMTVGQLLFEGVIIVLMLVLINYLMSRKVEI